MAKLALLIGVSEYRPGFNPLPAATQDVAAMQRILSHPEMGNFNHVQLLLNPEKQAMEEAIESLFANRQRDDLVLMFFSGHGVKDASGKLYLATCMTQKSAQGELVKSTAVSASFVHDIMNNSRSRHQVIVLDCCFSGAFAENLLAKDDGAIDIKTQLGGEGRVILTSSTSTQYSFEQKGTHLSIYTSYLIEGIETGAADANGDGTISADELHDYAKRRVQEAVPAMKPEIYAIKEGFKILLVKAPIRDLKQRYRKEVEQVTLNGQILIPDRQHLNGLRLQLGLSQLEADDIEVEVLQSYRNYQSALEQYRQVFSEAVRLEQPLSQATRLRLKQLQERWNLNPEDVASLESQISQALLPTPAPLVTEPSNTTRKQGRRASTTVGLIIGVIFLGVVSAVGFGIFKVITSILPPSPKFVDISTSGCVVTVENPLVDLHNEPNRFSRELSRVPPGNYQPTAHAITTKPSGQKEGWFQLQVKGRTGWIVDDTFMIESKSQTCP